MKIHEAINYIRDSFLSGSYAWGLNTYNSDVDIVVWSPQLHYLKKCFQVDSWEKSEYSDGEKGYCTENKITINVIPVNGFEYYKWKFATESFKWLEERYKLISKLDRNSKIARFQALKALATGCVGDIFSYGENDKKYEKKCEEITNYVKDCDIPFEGEA